MVQMHMMIVNYGCGTCRSKPCANSFAPMFLQVFRSRRFSLFSTMRLPLPLFGFLRLIFENFLMSPKGPPFIFLIFCKRTNVKKFPKVSFRFFGTMRLLKIRIFSKFFRSPQMVPLQFFFEISQKNECFLRPSTLYPIFFSKTGVFCMRLFHFFFIEVPPSIFTKNETFCDCKGLVKVFGTKRLQKICR